LQHGGALPGRASLFSFAQYLDHWLGVMKADKKAIFTATSKASETVTFLAALQGA
jgi:antirestriction protein ArdC